MNRILACLLVTCSVSAFAQIPQITPGATVYIEPMDGFETYLAASLVKKHVPVVVVTDKGNAEFFVRSTVNHSAPSQPSTVINNKNEINDSGNNGAFDSGFDAGMQAATRKAALGYSNASIAIVDPHTSRVAFAYTAAKGGTNQLQKTADDCAKHLKEFLEKSQKPKT